MTRALRVTAHGVLLLLACSQAQRPAFDPSAPPPPTPTAGTASTGRGGSAGTTGRAGSDPSTHADVPCTPMLSPGDEFYVPCADAGTALPPRVPGPDPDDPPTPDDAGTAQVAAPDAAVLPPAVFDQGPCAQQSDDCTFGHAATTVGSASCSIAGDFLSVRHELCEVCGLGTDLVDFSVAIMDCGGCTQVYREGTVQLDGPLAASACTERTQNVSLTLTLSNPDCVDVYAYVGSGKADFSGSFTQSSDQVRVCRCDRATDTCTTCVGGACDASP